MDLRRKQKLSQTMLDYSIMVAVVLLALFLMSHYISTGFAGKIKETADVFGGGEVYRPNPNNDDNIEPTTVKETTP
jgi:hypothetical protein